MLKNFIIFLGLILLAAPGFPQKLEAEISIQADRLDPSQQSKLQTLSRDLEQYINSYDYSDNAFGTKVPIMYQIYIQAVTQSGATDVYTAQVLVTNGIDQRYFDKAWDFPYAPGQILKHEIYSPVTGVIDYYAYLVLAGEVDTYAKLAGTQYYNNAQEIINLAQNSSFSKGWRDRVDKLNDLQNHRKLRVMKYSFFDAYWDIQESKLKDARVSFNDTMKLLNEIFTTNRDDKYTKIFMAGQADKFAWVAAKLGDVKALETLSRVDPDNKETYQSYLD